MNTFQDVINGTSRWSYENRDGFELAKILTLGSVHHVISDPPYDEKTHTSARSLKDGGSDINIDFDPLPDCSTFVPDLLKAAKRWVMCFCAQEQARDYQIGTRDDYFRRPKEERNYIRAIWWVRTNGAPQISGDRPAVPGETCCLMHNSRGEKKRWNGGGNRGYYIGPICEGEERLGHGTQKPEWLMMKIIADYTDVDDIIFDPTGGVGTTGAAALKLGRRFIGTELKGPCKVCGGGYPHDIDGDDKRRILAIAPHLQPCVHGHTNYHEIGRSRLQHISGSLKQGDLFGPPGALSPTKTGAKKGLKKNQGTLF